MTRGTKRLSCQATTRCSQVHLKLLSDGTESSSRAPGHRWENQELHQASIWSRLQTILSDSMKNILPKRHFRFLFYEGNSVNSTQSDKCKNTLAREPLLKLSFQTGMGEKTGDTTTVILAISFCMGDRIPHGLQVKIKMFLSKKNFNIQ